MFQSAPPVKGATPDRYHRPDAHAVSIRAPREGGDPTGLSLCRIGNGFQSAPPVKGATTDDQRACVADMFQSAPPVKGATSLSRQAKRQRRVSIRAPREGGDIRACLAQTPNGGFNPRPP